MFARVFLFGAGALALVCTLAIPDPLYAQKGQKGTRPGQLPKPFPNPKPQPKPKPPPNTCHPRPHGCDPCHHHHKHDCRHGHQCGQHCCGHHGNKWGFGAFQFGSFANPYLLAGGAPGIAAGGGPAGGSVLSGESGGTTNPTDTVGIMRAYSDGIRAEEEARILREQREVLRLETAKKRLEHQSYVESMTPSWTERQAKVAKQMLTHAQTTSNPADICSGRALNVLLADLRKHIGKKTFSSTPLGDELLQHVNVTTRENQGNLGLWRHGGSFSWPYALTQESLLSRTEREDIEAKVRGAVHEAIEGNPPGKSIKDLKPFLNATSDKLTRRVNDMSTSEYLEAKRFLGAFEAARLALEHGEAAAYFTFQRWASGGKTIQEVVDYLVQEGLMFASALPGDDSAYRALHSALAAYDVEVNPVAAPALASKDRP